MSASDVTYTPNEYREALNTAYAYNTRRQINRAPVVASGWDSRIDELLARDFAFLPYRYSEEGFLFRGVGCAWKETLRAGRWQLSSGAGPLAALERDLGVYLFSHELSDALLVARLWEPSRDAAVLVFPATEFHARWRRGAAAVLGFAEPGVVFKYPFMVEPLPLAALTLAVLPPGNHGPDDERYIALPDALAGDRCGIETFVRELLRQRHLTAAKPLATERYPRRR